MSENRLTAMYDEIRRLVMVMPPVQEELDYKRIIQERPPIGSSYTSRGGYTTPGGVVICRTLRNKLATLQEEYAEEARIQRGRSGLVRFTEPPRPLQPLIESEYMNPDLRPGFHRLPTPSPSPNETPLLHRRSRIQPRDAGN